MEKTELCVFRVCRADNVVHVLKNEEDRGFLFNLPHFIL